MYVSARAYTETSGNLQVARCHRCTCLLDTHTPCIITQLFRTCCPFFTYTMPLYCILLFWHTLSYYAHIIHYTDRISPTLTTPLFPPSTLQAKAIQDEEVIRQLKKENTQTKDTIHKLQVENNHLCNGLPFYSQTQSTGSFCAATSLHASFSVTC